MIRRPPRSTLFPYRRSSDLNKGEAEWPQFLRHKLREFNDGILVCRSEEHTSELQSQSNLVCRLLLEKKKERLNYIQRSKSISAVCYIVLFASSSPRLRCSRP